MAKKCRLSLLDLPLELQTQIVEHYYDCMWTPVYKHEGSKHCGLLMPAEGYDAYCYDTPDPLLLLNRHISRLAGTVRASTSSMVLEDATCDTTGTCPISYGSGPAFKPSFYSMLRRHFPALTTITARQWMSYCFGDTGLFVRQGTLQEVLDDNPESAYLAVLEHEFIDPDLDLGRARVRPPERCSEEDLAAFFGDVSVNFSMDFQLDTWEIGECDKHLTLSYVYVDYSISRDGCVVTDKRFESESSWSKESGVSAQTMPAGRFTLEAFQDRYSGAPTRWVGEYPEMDLRVLYKT